MHALFAAIVIALRMGSSVTTVTAITATTIWTTKRSDLELLKLVWIETRMHFTRKLVSYEHCFAPFWVLNLLNNMNVSRLLLSNVHR